jgi:hypothetical protein
LNYQVNEILEHQDSKHLRGDASQGFRLAFIILCLVTKASYPGSFIPGALFDYDHKPGKQIIGHHPP